LAAAGLPIFTLVIGFFSLKIKKKFAYGSEDCFLFN
jgi:hypothetical protein